MKKSLLVFFAFFLLFFINSNFVLGACVQDDVSSDCYVPEPEPLCVIEIGDFCSQTQGGWGAPCNGNNPGCLRDNYWDEVIGDNLTVGIGYNITFTAPSFVETFLPDGGSSSVLTQSYINPSSLGNTFASQVIALKLNVLFSDANIGSITPNLDVSIGELFITEGKFEGLTVYELLDIAEKVLGGNTSLLNDYDASISNLNEVVDKVNNNFVDCSNDKGFLEWLTCEEEPDPFCGDGVVNQPSEQCDGVDGLIEGFYCTSDCKLKPLILVCPLNEEDYDYIIDFDGKRLRSDQSEVNSKTQIIPFIIPQGSYNVTLVGHDAYLSRSSIAQPYEQYKLVFFNNGSVIAESNSHGDLEDYVNYVKLTEQVNINLSLGMNVDAVQGVHAFFPHSNPNSLNAVCAGLNLIEEEPDPVLGNLKVCKVLYNESDYLVSGSSLDVNFTLPLYNLSDAVFSTPLVYDDGLNCVVYEDLELGIYLFDEELIDSSDDFVFWDSPLYKLDNGFELFSDGVIELTEEYPNKTLFIKNKFYVNETTPKINKKIGLPKSPMSIEDIELGYLFFNEENGFDPALTTEFCDMQDENCVEVTLETEIDLGCIDAETNKSLNADVYFKVHWDAVDVTDEYCELYDGDIINDYCYVPQGVSSFYFQEESWHRLEYYCEYTSISSEVDIEYFKVKGTSFTIHFNKKWNLISVPYQLENNSPEAVFGSLNNVISIWTYDSLSGNWSSWAPNAPSNMVEVNPGWGYWVLMDSPENLTLAGSLLNPITTPPSKEIVHGWNLVGYYGTDGLLSYNGPLGQGKTASCAFNSLKVSEIAIPFSSLMTYWEPYNPNSWIYLNESSNLDPGAGYWIFSNENSFYAPTGPC